ARRAGQDIDRLLAAERTGIAVQGAERLRAARPRPDEARIASDSGQTLGIPVLRRPGGGARRRRVPACAGAPRRRRADAADARLVYELEVEGAPAARSF